MSVIVRCSIADNNKYQQYMTIKKGHHRPAIRFGWLMHPYFGGFPTAPHDMELNIKRI